LQPGPGGKQWFRVSLFAFRPGSRDPTNLRAFASGARLQSADCDAYVFSRMQASTSADCNRDPAVNNGFGFRCSSLDPTAEAQRTSLHVPPESACSQRTLRLTWHRSSAWVLEGSLAGYFVCRGLKDYSFVRLFVCSFVRLFGARGSPRGLKDNSFVRLFVCFCSRGPPRGLKDYSFVRLFVCSFVRLFGARGSPRGLKDNILVVGRIVV